MTTKRAGEPATAGFYFNTKSWELDLHRNDGGALAGSGTGDYVRVPALAMLILGPVLGFLFVIFLPFIGFALAARELGHRVAGWFGRRAEAPATQKPEANSTPSGSTKS